LIEWHATGVSLILPELAESAGAAGRSWNLAVDAARADPETALGHLIDAELRLDTDVRLERADTLRPIRAAIKRLDAELPDKKEDDSQGEFFGNDDIRLTVGGESGVASLLVLGSDGGPVEMRQDELRRLADSLLRCATRLDGP
jgi:hypothetical protein